jgi:hypothetical protein
VFNPSQLRELKITTSARKGIPKQFESTNTKKSLTFALPSNVIM